MCRTHRLITKEAIFYYYADNIPRYKNVHISRHKIKKQVCIKKVEKWHEVGELLLLRQHPSMVSEFLRSMILFFLVFLPSLFLPFFFAPSFLPGLFFAQSQFSLFFLKFPGYS